MYVYVYLYILYIYIYIDNTYTYTHPKPDGRKSTKHQLHSQGDCQGAKGPAPKGI